MADFNKLEMAPGYRRLGRIRASDGERKVSRCFACLLSTVVLITAGTLVTSSVSLWRQSRLETENFALKKEFSFLEARLLQSIEMTKPETEFISDLADSEKFEPETHDRLKRSSGDAKRRRESKSAGQSGLNPNSRADRKQHSKAVHFQLDVDGGTHTQFKWKIWNGPQSGTTTNPRGGSNGSQHHQYFLESARLSSDKTSVTINEPGLYIIYAQIQFENAVARNAFAVKVDNSPITKCFQSLDYFNKSLTATDNYRLKPCYSASIAVLRPHQVVSIVNLYSHRIFNDPYANYWGLIKFAD